MALPHKTIRQAFPFFQKNSESVYLDSASTTHKPQAVFDAMQKFYEEENANVHRGMHALTENASVQYEAARDTVKDFLGAAHREEIIFTHGTTEAINLVARSFGETSLQEGDTIAVSYLEHHSNSVPWLQVAEKTGCSVEWIPLNKEGNIDVNAYTKLLSNAQVQLVAITMQSNVLGVRPPLKEIISIAHNTGAKVFVDAAQSAAHEALDVQDLDCDFLAFSGHKIYGPTGVGALYGKKALLEAMPPFMGGGMMIQEVTTNGFTPADLPAKFEAGTPPIAEVIGLQAAIEWLQQYTWNDIEKHESTVLEYAHQQLESVEGLHILSPKDAHGCLSFVIDGVHPHDLTDILGQQHIALRAGHHCAMPLHTYLGIPASTRLSVGIYSSTQDIDRLVPALQKACEILRR